MRMLTSDSLSSFDTASCKRATNGFKIFNCQARKLILWLLRLTYFFSLRDMLCNKVCMKKNKVHVWQIITKREKKSKILHFYFNTGSEGGSMTEI